ncbi:MBL fold metallo-hydrolase [Flagellimonas meridianipacifica]|uniref:L-ascorbate metabolism protein UlaG (Beta-lactamase superfamily) n=1 Tax=Flagellimonas meridianipacifica TaxID=1080225 RepID=A0A2T0MI48_9FLAO|nr:MBL fold metallo-hydrolase [Allomuricauda pacifica]PRX57215.1 L-ascorbate metabolism protein UlaG (beta-lactamase superfamily) [Allomuricauda pacifica]
MKDFDIHFKWVGAPTWVIQIDNLKIACDPVLCPINTVQDHKYFRAKRRSEPHYGGKDFEDIDFWLLTHRHEDHIDSYGVVQINPHTKVYAHKNLKSWLRLIYHRNTEYMKWGAKATFVKEDVKVTIEAIPCVHASNFLASKLAGGVNGYWLDIEKPASSLSVYVTGDTVNHSKVKRSLEGRTVDILIPNVGGGGLDRFGGPYTFTAETLMDITELINPKRILPVHHKSFSLYKEPISKLYALKDERVLKFNEGDSVSV